MWLCMRPQVKRLDEMARKLRFFADQVSRRSSPTTQV